MGRLVTAQIFNSPTEAIIAKSLIEQHGFLAWLPNWNHYSVLPWIGIALGGLPLKVLDCDVDEIRTILASRIDSTAEDRADAELCPDCGSHRIFHRPHYSRFILFAFSGVPAPDDANYRVCRSCGHLWQSRPARLVHKIGIAVLLLTFILVLLTDFFRI